MTDWLRTQDEQQEAVEAEKAQTELALAWGHYWHEQAVQLQLAAFHFPWKELEGLQASNALHAANEEYWREEAEMAREEAATWKHNYNTSRRVRQLLEDQLREQTAPAQDLALARAASGGAAASTHASNAKSNTPVKPQDVVVDDSTGLSVGW